MGSKHDVITRSVRPYFCIPSICKLDWDHFMKQKIFCKKTGTTISAILQEFGLTMKGFCIVLPPLDLTILILSPYPFQKNYLTLKFAINNLINSRKITYANKIEGVN